jgi:hypothetical protein
MIRNSVPSSAAAKALAEPAKTIAKYPWRTMEVWESFAVAPNEATWTTINTSCYKWSKKLNKKFRAINHGDKGIEVARLPMSEVRTSFVDAMEKAE